MSESCFRSWRLNQGFTQAQSATILGYSLRQIKFYDQGFKEPDRTLRWAMLAISEGLKLDENAGTPPASVAA